MTRAEFLKKIGVFVVAIMTAIGLKKPEIIIGDDNNEQYITSETAPKDTSKIWVDSRGVARYWDGFKWKNIKATWG
jgi:hypothetical protein